VSDLGTFLRAWARDRKGVGAVAPSSPDLARLLVDAADIRRGDVVVELGAGTGPMTRALVDRHPDTPLLVLEPDPVLAARCRQNVPEADVVEAYAQELPRLLSERGHRSADRMVSSLPFAGWDAALQTAVFDAILDAMAPDGRFVTFTYAVSPLLPAGRRARAQLASRFASVRATPIVWRNLPPAFVYVCDRQVGG
jgi:phospholipid N-methyltransferase